MGDRIVVMKSGVLQQVDTPQNLYERPANMFVAGFIGSPAMNMAPVTVEGGEGGMYLQGTGFRLRVPAHYAQRLSGQVGRQIHLGIRPEAIHDARYYREGDPSNVVEAHVDLAEPLGRDLMLYVSVQNQQFVARLDDRTDVVPGNTLRLAFDMEQMHAFDPTTERTLL